MDLSNFIVNPVTLALVVHGVVEFIKKLGVSGNKLLLIAMCVGVLFGIVYQCRLLLPAAQQYIDVIFFGLAVGLGASGVYSFIDSRFPPQTKTSTESKQFDPDCKGIKKEVL